MAGSLSPIVSWVKWGGGGPAVIGRLPGACMLGGGITQRDTYRVSLPSGEHFQGALQALVLSLPLCKKASRIKSPLVKLADDTWVGRWQNLGRGARRAAGDELGHHRAGHNRQSKAVVAPHRSRAAQHPWGLLLPPGAGRDDGGRAQLWGRWVGGCRGALKRAKVPGEPGLGRGRWRPAPAKFRAHSGEKKK